MKLEEVHKQVVLEDKAKEEAQAKKASPKGGKKSVKLEPKETGKKSVKLEPKEIVTGSPKQRNGGEAAKQQRSSGKTAPSKPPASPVVVKPASSPVASSPKSSSTESSPRTGPFDLRAFRRELTDVLKELGPTRDTAKARGRFSGLKVPSNLQAREFSNLLTRVAEERCSASRRAMFAFIAGLTGSVFDKEMCAEGTKSFFDDVFDDLCEEVPRLPEILKTEFVPTIRAALPAGALCKIMPAALK